jgi:hypothetical protein
LYILWTMPISQRVYFRYSRWWFYISWTWKVLVYFVSFQMYKMPLQQQGWTEKAVKVRPQQLTMWKYQKRPPPRDHHHTTSHSCQGLPHTSTCQADTQRSLMILSGVSTECLVNEVASVLNEAHFPEDVFGNGGIAPHILNLSTGWRWVVTFMPRGPTGWGWVDLRPSVNAVKRKISLTLLQIKPRSLSHPAYSLTIIHTELSTVLMKMCWRYSSRHS